MDSEVVMEAVLDLQISYSTPGLEHIVTDLDLMEKICGNDNENTHYIEETVGAKIDIDPKWTGIQDGVTFNIKHQTVSGIRDAEYLISQVLETVQEDVATFLGAINKAPNAITLKHDVSSVTCGLCRRSHRSSLSDFEKHVKSHPKEKVQVEKKVEKKTERKAEELEKQPSPVQGKEMTMAAFAQSLHTMYSIPAQSGAASSEPVPQKHDNTSQRVPPSERDHKNSYPSYSENDETVTEKAIFSSVKEKSTAGEGATNQTNDRVATAAYYAELRKYLGAGGDTPVAASIHEPDNRNIDAPPAKSLRNKALSILADYRSVSRSPDSLRAEISKKQKSRSRSKSRSKKKKKKKRKRSYSSDSSSSRSRSKSKDRYGKWRRSRSRSRYRRKSPSSSGSSSPMERSRKRSYSRSSSRGSSQKRSRHSTPSDSTRSDGLTPGSVGFKYRGEGDAGYSSVTNEMIENPHISEPLVVAQARKEILMDSRLKKGTITDIECQLLIDCLTRDTTSTEKKEIESIVENTNKFYKPYKKSEILTAQLNGVCKFLLKRRERSQINPSIPYPYTKKTGELSKPPPRDKDLYPDIKSDDIKNYKPTEPLEVSKGRLVILERKWREGVMNKPLAEKLIQMLQKNLSEKKEEVDKHIMKRSLQFKLPWKVLSPNQQIESKLLGTCDYIIETNTNRLRKTKLAVKKELEKKVRNVEIVKTKRLRSGSPSSPTSRGSRRSRSRTPTQNRRWSPHRRSVSRSRSRSPMRRYHSPGRRSHHSPPRRRSHSQSRGRSRSRSRRRSRSRSRRRSRSRSRRRSRSWSRRRSRSQSRRRSRSRSRRRSVSRSRRRSRSRSRRRSRSRSRRRSFSPSRRRPRNRSHSPRARPSQRRASPIHIMSRREIEDMAINNPNEVIRLRKDEKLGDTEMEEALTALKDTMTWDNRKMFERMAEQEPFATEYRAAPRYLKLTMEFAVLCSFLSRHVSKLPESDSRAPGALASRALKQVKDQAKQRGRDMEQSTSASPSEGAVAELIQEIQQQTRLLRAEPRDLPHQMILMPHENEPEFVARARYAIFLEDRQYGKLNDQQAARVLEDIKKNLPQDEKDLIAKMVAEEKKRLLEQDENCMTKSFEFTVSLKVTCEYFLCRSQKLPHPDDMYPYAHLLGDNDSHIDGLSRNGQYKDVPPADRATLRTTDIQECVKLLAEQNNVPCCFSVEKVQGSLHNAVVKLGSSMYMAESVTSADEAQQNASFDALTKTFYGFSKMPAMLHKFKHKKNVLRTIVRSFDPLKSAGAMTQILADQNKVSKRYKTDRDGFTFRATLLLGNKVYKGSGITAEIAQNIADYFAIQQSNFDFSTPPPGVAKGVSGEGFNTVTADMKTLIDNRKSKDSSMSNDLTYLVTEELKLSAKLTVEEYCAINRRIHDLPERIPCDAGCLMAEVERYIDFSTQAQRKKFMTNGKKRVAAYIKLGKMCTLESILEETRELHEGVLKILESPVSETVTPCNKRKEWIKLKRTKELEWTCELIEFKTAGKPLTSEWLEATAPRPRKLLDIKRAAKKASPGSPKDVPTEVQIKEKAATAEIQREKNNTIKPLEFPFEMSTLPLIPTFEEIKSTTIPITDRLAMMQSRIAQLINDRKKKTVTDLYLMSIISSIKQKLSPNEVQRVDKLTLKSEPLMPPGTETSGTDVALKLDHQFKGLSSFVVEKLKKDTTVISQFRYNEITNPKSAQKEESVHDPWGVVSQNKNTAPPTVVASQISVDPVPATRVTAPTVPVHPVPVSMTPPPAIPPLPVPAPTVPVHHVPVPTIPPPAIPPLPVPASTVPVHHVPVPTIPPPAIPPLPVPVSTVPVHHVPVPTIPPPAIPPLPVPAPTVPVHPVPVSVIPPPTIPSLPVPTPIFPVPSVNVPPFLQPPVSAPAVPTHPLPAQSTAITEGADSLNTKQNVSASTPVNIVSTAPKDSVRSGLDTVTQQMADSSDGDRNQSFESEERVVDTFCNAVANLESTSSVTSCDGNSSEATVCHNQEVQEDKIDEDVPVDSHPEGIIVITPMDEGETIPTSVQNVGKENETAFWNIVPEQSEEKVATNLTPQETESAVQGKPTNDDPASGSNDSLFNQNSVQRSVSTSSDGGAVVAPAMIVPMTDTSDTDNVTISIVRKDDGSTEFVVQTFKEDDSTGYGSAMLPWIPTLEPTDLTNAPAEKRYRAMKAKVTEIMSDRESLKLNTKETTDIMKKIRAKLGKDDLNEVKTLTDNAVKEIPPEAKKAPGTWKMTQRLKILCQYILEKIGVSEETETTVGVSSGTGQLEEQGNRVEQQETHSQPKSLPSYLPHPSDSAQNANNESPNVQETPVVSSGSIIPMGQCSSHEVTSSLSIAQVLPSATSNIQVSNTSEGQTVQTVQKSDKTTSSLPAVSSSNDVSAQNIDPQPRAAKSPKVKKVKYPLRTHVMTSSKEVPISDEISLPEDPLPWIPELEPNNLTGSPVQERYEASKKYVTDLLNRRKECEINDPDTSHLIQAVIGRLDTRDVQRLDAVRNRVITYKGHSPAARPFILTQQLQMICFYILQRLEKQPEAVQKTVSGWLKSKAEEYHTELDMFCLTNSAIKERAEALTLQLTDIQKKAVGDMIKCESLEMKKLFVWESQVMFLMNVISLELNCVYILRLASGSDEPLKCTLTKKFADILLDKKKVSNMDPFDSEDAVKVVKKALSASVETEIADETELVDLDSSEQPAPSMRIRKPTIKLTLANAKN